MMEESVKNLLANDEERNLWSEIFKVFQEKGEEGVTTFLNEVMEEMKKEFEDYKNQINNILGDRS